MKNFSIKEIKIQKIIGITTFIGLSVFLFFIYGLIPGLYVNNFSAMTMMAANTQCVINDGIFSISYCSNFGFPIGYPFLEGLPFIYLSAITAKLFNLSPYIANVLTGILFIEVALISVYLLLIKLGSKKFIAIMMGFLFLSLPIIYKQSGYLYLMYGFALIPLYILLEAFLIRNFANNQRKTTLMIFSTLAIYTAIRSLSIFMDGYSFVMSGTISGLIVCFFILKSIKKDSITYLRIPAIIIIGNISAILLYQFYVPGNANYPIMPIDFFRAAGIDVVGFLLPSEAYLLADKLDIAKNWEGLKFYGDGSNISMYYIGFILLVTYLFYLFTKVKKTNFIHKVIIIAGILAFIISLGPSIKINDTREVENKINITFSDYLMPPEAATINMHTDQLFVKIPGINNMRAVHRWYIIFILSVIVTSSLFLTDISKKQKILSYLILGLIIVELFPNIGTLNGKYTNNYHALKNFDKDVIETMQKYIGEDEKIFFISKENDFLANYISAKLNTKSYNAGGDKNFGITSKFWPNTIKNMRNTGEQNLNVYAAIKEGGVDKIILPHFNLRWNSYSWPPKKPTYDPNTFDTADTRFLYTKTNWFTIITPNPNPSQL